MRTNIVIDNRLMKQALEISGLETKKAVVEEALKLLIQMKKQRVVRNLRGKLRWEGELDQMRIDL
ncbi:MAG: type II toxin-antitoxin system VapB family antitoxin [bacterium]